MSVPGISTSELVAPRLQSWPEFLSGVTLFSNAIRLRHFIWTIERYIPLASRLLEVGCGTGTAALLLSDMGYEVTAVDVDPTLIASIRQRYSDWLRPGRLELRVADMFALPWTSQEFDLAYHQGVLEHFPDEQIVQALHEQRRVSKRLIFDVPNHRYGDHPFGDERLLRPSHWRRMLQQAGWRVRQQLGRDFHHGLYLLPHFLFAHKALEKLPWFSRSFAVSSIFVCE